MPARANEYLKWDGPPMVLRLSDGRRDPAGSFTLNIATIVWPHLGADAGNMLFVDAAVELQPGLRAVAGEDFLVADLSTFQAELRQIELTCDGHALLARGGLELSVFSQPDLRGAAILECTFQWDRYFKAGKELTSWPADLPTHFRAHDCLPTLFRCAALCDHEALVSFIHDFDTTIAALDDLRVPADE